MSDKIRTINDAAEIPFANGISDTDAVMGTGSATDTSADTGADANTPTTNTAGMDRDTDADTSADTDTGAAADTGMGTATDAVADTATPPTIAANTPPTIAAIATPFGTGGIGVIRLSGPEAFAVLDRLFVSSRKPLPPRRLTYGRIADPGTGEVVDEAMAVKMPRPRSYTKEDVAEIHCHAGAAVLRKILGLTFRCGARPAEPGEFTKRAFLNGRIDLSQAEAVMGIIKAESERAGRAAASQLRGGLAKALEPALDALLGLLARIELSIDYPEHGEDAVNRAEVLSEAARIGALLRGLEKSAEAGKVYAQGLKTAIIGRPNVGKSSLLNALTGSERAIVTDIPGTTRDAVTEKALLNDIPLLLTDTAGIRESGDLIEKLGVEKSLERAVEADLILWVVDGSEGLLSEDIAALKALGAADADEGGFGAKKIVCVLNKSDLPQKIGEDRLLVSPGAEEPALFGVIGAKKTVCDLNKSDLPQKTGEDRLLVSPGAEEPALFGGIGAKRTVCDLNKSDLPQKTGEDRLLVSPGAGEPALFGGIGAKKTACDLNKSDLPQKTGEDRFLVSPGAGESALFTGIGAKKTMCDLNKSDSPQKTGENSLLMSPGAEEPALFEMIGAKKILSDLNKNDLPQKTGKARLLVSPGAEEPALFSGIGAVCGVSAKERTGLPELGNAIERLFLSEGFSEGLQSRDADLITNERHRLAIVHARERLDAALEAARSGLPEDLLAVDLSEAYGLLGGILGRDVGEDVVERIFSEFCVGK